MCRVFRYARKCLAEKLFANVPQVYFVGGFGTRNYQLTKKIKYEKRNFN